MSPNADPVPPGGNFENKSDTIRYRVPFEAMRSPRTLLWPTLSARLLGSEDITYLCAADQAASASRAFGEELYILLESLLRFRRACSHASFSRVFENPFLFGHISGHLISNELADKIESQTDETAFYALNNVRPLSDQQLRAANRTLEGSSLLITHVSWNLSSTEIDVFFLDEAIEHLVRWFEGNTISSVLFRSFEPCEQLIQPLLASFDSTDVRRTEASHGSFINRVFAPWKPTGVANQWGKRLLDVYGDPSVFIPDHRKLKGRILHEFDFDVVAAVRSGCIPTWSLNDTGKRLDCASANKWRRKVADNLLVNIDRSQGANTMDSIRRRVAAAPRLLSLY